MFRSCDIGCATAVPSCTLQHGREGQRERCEGWRTCGQACTSDGVAGAEDEVHGAGEFQLAACGAAVGRPKKCEVLAQRQDGKMGWEHI
jgi:Na+-translocating ferredoxin:NAD+ oxidoreductase RNF subunit RnfB